MAARAVQPNPQQPDSGCDWLAEEDLQLTADQQTTMMQLPGHQSAK